MHFFPTVSSKLRTVLRFTPVTLSIERIDIPSTSNCKHVTALSSLRYILPSIFSRDSLKVLLQVTHRKRWLPFRSLPFLFASLLQVSQFIFASPLCCYVYYYA